MQPFQPAGHACLRSLFPMPPVVPPRPAVVVPPPAPSSGLVSGGRLSAQQAAVARLASEGRRDEDIAAALGIGAATVKVHLRAVYRRLGVAGRVGLAEALGAERPARADLDRVARDHGLTGAETDALWHLIRGDANKIIARRLAVSVSTVKLRLRRVYRVTSTTHRAELAAAVRGWF